MALELDSLEETNEEKYKRSKCTISCRYGLLHKRQGSYSGSSSLIVQLVQLSSCHVTLQVFCYTAASFYNPRIDRERHRKRSTKREDWKWERAIEVEWKVNYSDTAEFLPSSHAWSELFADEQNSLVVMLGTQLEVSNIQMAFFCSKSINPNELSNSQSIWQAKPCCSTHPFFRDWTCCVGLSHNCNLLSYKWEIVCRFKGLTVQCAR